MELLVKMSMLYKHLQEINSAAASLPARPSSSHALSSEYSTTSCSTSTLYFIYTETKHEPHNAIKCENYVKFRAEEHCCFMF